jgi:hypothetical protein
MFAAIKTLISKWLRPKSSEPKHQTDTSTHSIAQDDSALSFKQVSQHDGDTHYSDLVPYEENLLERSRTQWQFGDWESLAALNRERLQHHPDRAKLALLAGAGKMQNNQMSEARQLIHLAQDWGVSRKLVTQILTSGVHNSLGRAAVISNQQHRALQHFENSIAIGMQGSDSKLLIQARCNEQINQLDLPKVSFIEKSVDELEKKSIKAVLNNQNDETLIAIIKKQNSYLEDQFKSQAKELSSLRKNLEKSVKAEITNATKQLEAFFDIQSYFESGQVIGELHGWPISPDLGLYLIQELENNSYDLVIEFGSGTSTQLISKSLRAIASRLPNRSKVVQVAFEHFEQYYQNTLSILQQSGLSEYVSLYFAPLKDYIGPDGSNYLYYECEESLKTLSVSINMTSPNILVFVDGPPASTGKHARYPALPLIIKYFPDSRIDLILDDYNRPEEKEVVEKWVSELIILGKIRNKAVIPLDKGACKLSIN